MSDGIVPASDGRGEGVQVSRRLFTQWSEDVDEDPGRELG